MTQPIPIQTRCSGLCTVHCPPEHIHDGDGTVEGCPGCFWELPDLAYELAYLLRVTEIVDRHLDEAAPEIYRQDNDASRLLNRWRRIAGGPASEGQEAVDALNEASGGNPRKGVVGDDPASPHTGSDSRTG